MKKIIYILMCVLGLLIFFSLYVIVSIITETEFPNLKYLVMGLGYISVGLFVSGFLLLINKQKKVENKDVEE